MILIVVVANIVPNALTAKGALTANPIANPIANLIAGIKCLTPQRRGVVGKHTGSLSL